MRLPAPLLRRLKNVHKKTFGHVLVIAGSSRMLGAGALTSLAAMRCGAGLVTWAIPESLNTTAQKKCSNVVMTWPLPQTKEGSFSFNAFEAIRINYPKFNALAIGPGMGLHPSTRQLILKIIKTSPIPVVIDADALNALAGHLELLIRTSTAKILTPHPGEMARLTGLSTQSIESNREKLTRQFAQQYRCVLLLKGYRTVVAAPDKKIYINKTGNTGMATAGSGDVLTGMITALLAQGVHPFESAKWGTCLHGKAGDHAAKIKTKAALIATDIIETIPLAIKDNIV